MTETGESFFLLADRRAKCSTHEAVGRTTTTTTNQLICLAPGCDFLTPSEATLNDHYSCHFGRGRALSDVQPPYPHSLDQDEIHVNHLVSKLRAKVDRTGSPYPNLTIETLSSTSLLRKFFQLNNDQYTVGLNRVGLNYIQLRIDNPLYLNIDNPLYHRQLGDVRLEFQTSVHTSTDPLPFAWLYALLGIHNSCRCACCAPSTLIDGLVDQFNLCRGRYKYSWNASLTLAWRQHFFIEGLYRCDAPGCTHRCKRWADLERHTSTSHCLNAKKFPCKYPGCERAGDNGFPRKDKLKSHFENVHRGVGIPPKHPRALVPKK